MEQRVTRSILAAANLTAGDLCQIERDGWAYSADGRNEAHCIGCGYAARTITAGEVVTLYTEVSGLDLPQRHHH